MSAMYELAALTLDFLGDLQPTSEWYKQKLEELADAQKKAMIAKASAKRTELLAKAQREHELALLKVRLSADIELKRFQEKLLVRDYTEFRNSLEELKQKLLATFPDIPKPLIYSIYHHAKCLLDATLNAPDEASHAKSLSRFAEFLIAVYKDTENALLSDQEPQFLVETLHLIDNSIAFDANHEDSKDAVKPKMSPVMLFHAFANRLSLPLLVLKEIFRYPLKDTVITAFNNIYEVVRD
jgi:hypothetical protein